MTILDAARAHFSETRGELASVYVPEWDRPAAGFDGRIYYYPRLSFEEMRVVLQSQPALERQDIEGALSVLISRARDSHGNRIFRERDREMLSRSASPEILLHVVTQINANTVEVPADAESKSATG